MMEGGWLICVSPWRMVAFLRENHKPSDRKWLLLAVASARRIWESLSNKERHAYEVAERYAEGKATLEELSEEALPRKLNARKHATRLRQFVDGALTSARQKPAQHAYAQIYEAIVGDLTLERSRRVAQELGLSDGAARDPRDAWVEASAREDFAQETMVRDLFGNPFRPIVFDPAWLTPGVVELAQAIYTEQAFDRLPALGDALEAAGCQDAEILKHCRSENPHIRGCWVVDSLLGKS